MTASSSKKALISRLKSSANFQKKKMEGSSSRYSRRNQMGEQHGFLGVLLVEELDGLINKASILWALPGLVLLDSVPAHSLDRFVCIWWLFL